MTLVSADKSSEDYSDLTNSRTLEAQLQPGAYSLHIYDQFLPKFYQKIQKYGKKQLDLPEDISLSTLCFPYSYQLKITPTNFTYDYPQVVSITPYREMTMISGKEDVVISMKLSHKPYVKAFNGKLVEGDENNMKPAFNMQIRSMNRNAVLQNIEPKDIVIEGDTDLEVVFDKKDFEADKRHYFTLEDDSLFSNDSKPFMQLTSLPAFR